MYEDYHYNSYDEDERLPKWWMIAYAVLFALLALVCLCGCTTTKYVPVETVRTEVRYKEVLRYDSVYHHDSVYVEVRGDSVKQTRRIEDFRVLFLNRTDTVHKTDSVPKPYPVEVKVEKPLLWYDTLCLWLGRITFIALAVFAAYKVGKRKKG